MEFYFVYMTAPTMAEAEAIGEVLVTERLVASVNLMDQMRAIYWWKGKKVSRKEVVLLAKTKASLVQAVIRKVTRMHSYECPCVVSVPMSQGNPDFMDWIAEETR
ncbi:MAG: divalent-cation tolerance protein CutA [Deltaproteobacteria bacterium]|nr:divalent-cation tolerance protein CutA [Deltaproteobacteria bacterium]